MEKSDVLVFSFCPPYLKDWMVTLIREITRFSEDELTTEELKNCDIEPDAPVFNKPIEPKSYSGNAMYFN